MTEATALASLLSKDALLLTLLGGGLLIVLALIWTIRCCIAELRRKF